MSHHLVVKSPDSEPVQYVLRAERIGLGRGRDNQICVLCERVSTFHLELSTNDEGECWIEDLNSANGTTVNGEPLHTPVCLRDGDRILIGDAVGAHYFQPNPLNEDSPELAMEVDFALSEDLAVLNDKVHDLEAQVKILNRQYSDKLQEFQTLVKLLERVKTSIDDSGQNDGDDATTAEQIIEELERAKTRIALHGIDVSAREVAYEADPSPAVKKKSILRWLR